MTVSGGAQGYVLAGGTASGTHVNGGIYVVYGSNTGTTINSGGAEYVYSGATESGTIVNSGLQVVFGTVTGTTVSSGGEQYVVSGGTASGTTIVSGGPGVAPAANGFWNRWPSEKTTGKRCASHGPCCVRAGLWHDLMTRHNFASPGRPSDVARKSFTYGGAASTLPA